MYIIEAESRDIKVKSKRLRAKGLVPCNISIGEQGESVLIQLPEKTARRLMKEKGRGGIVLIKCDEKEYNVIIKDIGYNQLSSQIDDIVFQQLQDHVYVNSVARVIITNENNLQIMAHLSVKEIPYRALPEDLVETVKIDLSELKSGAGLTVQDLPMSNNDKVVILIDKSRLVLNMADHSRGGRQAAGEN